MRSGEIAPTTDNFIVAATVLGSDELRRGIKDRYRSVKVEWDNLRNPSEDLCKVADKLNSRKLSVADKYQKQIEMGIRASTIENIPHNIRSLILICDNWARWMNWGRNSIQTRIKGMIY
jgi:hypothetical protein